MPPPTNEAHAPARAELLALGNAHCRGLIPATRHFGSPLFAKLLEGLATDLDLLAIMHRGRAGQPLGNLFLSCAYYLVLQHPQEALARYFPGLSESPLPFDDIQPVFHEFCLRHADTLGAMMARLTWQSTSAERAYAVLLPLAELHARLREPVALLEIGPSAGLCMLFEHYAYDFGPQGWFGPAHSPVRLRTGFRGAAPRMPTSMPAISKRAGIDLHPVNVEDASALNWIQACLYPEWIEATANLRAALTMRAQSPLDIVAGDATVVLAEVLRTMPDPICLLNANCLYQWPIALREQFDRQIVELGRSRPIWRISIEPDAMTVEAIYAAFSGGEGIPIYIDLMRYEGGQRHVERLGICDGYARWIDWRATH
ncbi:MAG: DUF2332 domain-containing protein [Gammaproteobacteria bacterium]